MSIEGGLSRCLTCLALWVFEGSFVGYEGIQGAFEELWISGAGSVEEPGILRRQVQGCVEPSGGFEVPNPPLSALTGVQLAPIKPKLVNGDFANYPRLVRFL
jgi:hypothetical protein